MLVLIINDGPSFAHEIADLRASKTGFPFFSLAEIRMEEHKNYVSGMLVN